MSDNWMQCVILDFLLQKKDIIETTEDTNKIYRLDNNAVKC